MRALPKAGGVQLGRVGKGQKLHYIVGDGVPLCGRYARDDDRDVIDRLAAQHGEHLEATCGWCRWVAEDDDVEPVPDESRQK